MYLKRSTTKLQHNNNKKHSNVHISSTENERSPYIRKKTIYIQKKERKKKCEREKEQQEKKKKS